MIIFTVDTFMPRLRKVLYVDSRGGYYARPSDNYFQPMKFGTSGLFYLH